VSWYGSTSVSNYDSTLEPVCPVTTILCIFLYILNDYHYYGKYFQRDSYTSISSFGYSQGIRLRFLLEDLTVLNGLAFELILLAPKVSHLLLDVIGRFESGSSELGPVVPVGIVISLLRVLSRARSISRYSLDVWCFARFKKKRYLL
jgi:hypothetical protein